MDQFIKVHQFMTFENSDGEDETELCRTLINVDCIEEVYESKGSDDDFPEARCFVSVDYSDEPLPLAESFTSVAAQLGYEF